MNWLRYWFSRDRGSCFFFWSMVGFDIILIIYFYAYILTVLNITLLSIVSLSDDTKYSRISPLYSTTGIDSPFHCARPVYLQCPWKPTPASHHVSHWLRLEFNTFIHSVVAYCSWLLILAKYLLKHSLNFRWIQHPTKMQFKHPYQLPTHSLHAFSIEICVANRMINIWIQIEFTTFDHTR